jgi:hypothetical protein
MFAVTKSTHATSAEQDKQVQACGICPFAFLSVKILKISLNMTNVLIQFKRLKKTLEEGLSLGSINHVMITCKSQSRLDFV